MALAGGRPAAASPEGQLLYVQEGGGPLTHFLLALMVGWLAMAVALVHAGLRALALVPGALT